jgi:hypothetical protein
LEFGVWSLEFGVWKIAEQGSQLNWLIKLRRSETLVEAKEENDLECSSVGAQHG